MKKFITVFILFLLVLAVPKGTSAQNSQYQPGPSYSIVIDKFVGVPTSQGGEIVYNYVDNLGVNDFKFRADNIVFFKLKIKNTSNANLDNVVIKDTAPSYITIFDNPGTFDSNSRVLTINEGTLAAYEEKEYILTARVASSSDLPGGSNITCVINRVVASNDKVSDEDTAQLCIEKQVLGEQTVPPVTKIPSAGPENGLAILSLSGLLGYFGLRLRKYNK